MLTDQQFGDTEAVQKAPSPRMRTPVIILVVSAIGAIGALLYSLFTVTEIDF